ncbi:MAG: GNAT family N-acetyltransferase [Pseudomonadaceae bacterium]|nr:GNAT family N-acetyltransferase [Pseudomonadaceae bacterium]
MAFKLREIEVFRPYSTEVPEDLLWSMNFSEQEIDRWLNCDLLRVAKLGEQVMGVYAMDVADGVTYVLHGVVVAPSARKQGLGRWLVGHALGVAESKGARGVLFPHQSHSRFLATIGFEANEQGQRFEMYQE